MNLNNLPPSERRKALRMKSDIAWHKIYHSEKIKEIEEDITWFKSRWNFREVFVRGGALNYHKEQMLLIEAVEKGEL